MLAPQRPFIILTGVAVFALATGLLFLGSVFHRYGGYVGYSLRDVLDSLQSSLST
jgi:hypothetical protein